MKLEDLKFPLNKLAILCFSVLALSLSSCIDDEGNVTPDLDSVAYVSFYHGAPDSPPLDIKVDTIPINNRPLEYTQYIEYLRFYPGERSFKFSAYNAVDILTDTTVDLESNKVYSMFVVSGENGIETLMVEDGDLDPGEGNIAIRLVHLSPDAPAVDFTAEEEVLFEDVAYKSATSFTEIPIETSSFELTTADGEVLATISDLDFTDGGVYTFVVRGFVSPPVGNDNELGVQLLFNY